jgi:hypothetical protein
MTIEVGVGQRRYLRGGTQSTERMKKYRRRDEKRRRRREGSGAP